ncbi:MAG: glycosyltransferase family A protein [Bacteroidota bacterium]
MERLTASGLVKRIYLLSTGKSGGTIRGCTPLPVDSLHGSQTVRRIAAKAGTPYALFVLHDTELEFGQFGLERMLDVARGTGAGIIYSDYHDVRDGKFLPHQVIDYQLGSIRDDFNFGSMLFLKSAALKEAAVELRGDRYAYAGVYAARLAISRKHPLVRIGEFLYNKIESDVRKSGEKLFDYVDPRNRQVQIEMEQAATFHLKKIGAYLKPEFKRVTVGAGDFALEASVVIPVRDRVKTVSHAVESALRQTPPFLFNVIVVDNHSTDGTTDLLLQYAGRDQRLLHIVPERKDLGIGGCWNEAVHHPECGRFAVQLDSDDLYKDPSTLERVVEVFYRERCGMVVGSYQMTNYDLEPIPPGVIDHKEWTPENGRNNALRVNGLGAPRAFYTPLVRKIKIPNVSYGEDYALGLAISREYQIGRIYEPIYLCRRWEGNSDADLDVAKLNSFNLYKDRLRTFEILARKGKNAGARSKKRRR